MPDATFDCPNLTKVARLDELGLEVTDQLTRIDRSTVLGDRRPIRRSSLAEEYEVHAGGAIRP